VTGRKIQTRRAAVTDSPGTRAGISERRILLTDRTVPAQLTRQFLCSRLPVTLAHAARILGNYGVGVEVTAISAP
jgi:hypothetical protein